MSYNTILATAPLTTQNYHLKMIGTSIGNSLIWDNGTNVGIGNTNTSYTLDVSGSLRSTTSAYFATTSGNIGIGTASPVSTNLVGSQTIVKSYNSDTPTSTTAQTYYTNQSNLYLFGRNAGLSIICPATNEEGSIFFGNSLSVAYASINTSSGTTSVGGDMYFKVGSNTERMRITSAGLVGIGTSSPINKLSVYVSDATTYSSTSTGNILTLYNTSTTTNGYAGIDFISEPTSGNAGRAAINMIVTGSGTADLAFSTRNSTMGERMRITSGGNVLVGTSTDVTTNVAGVMFAKVGTQGRMTIGSTSTGAQDIAYFFNPNGIVGYIQTSGSSTVYSTNGSDIALKKNIESWDEKVLDNFNTIDAKLFNYKTEEDGTAKTKGYIANDAVNYFPEAYPKNESGMYSFNPSGMVVYLMKAIQEQNERIQNLQEQINILAK